MKLREYADNIPKPMVEIGYRPILWHVMKYYAHYGHKDFILCLGYRGDVIKNYFLNYSECISNDFVLSKGSRNPKLLHRDIDDWTITFADTGLSSNIGQRMLAVGKYLEGEDFFLANYADGLTDLHLPSMIDHFMARDKTAIFAAVKPRHSFHVVSLKNGDQVDDIQHLTQSGIWINGGFFAFKKKSSNILKTGRNWLRSHSGGLLKKES